MDYGRPPRELTARPTEKLMPYRLVHQDRPSVSYVIPAHNSGWLIDRTVNRLATRLERMSAEVIVVENGSTDDTWERCQSIASHWTLKEVTFRALQSPKGMGNALRKGLLESHGSHVLLSADDLPFGFDDLDGWTELRRSGTTPAFVMGSKAHPDSRVHRGARRDLLTGGFSRLCRAVLGMRTKDPQGTMVLDAELGRELVGRARETGFLFSTELVHLAERMGVVPMEMPVRLSSDEQQHASRVSVVDAISMAGGLLRIRWRHRRVTGTVPRPNTGPTP